MSLEVSFYCKNLGSTGLGRDKEAVLYPDLESAVKAYLAAEPGGKMLGYKIGDVESVMAYFNLVDMKSHYVKNASNIEFFDDLAENEKKIVRDALQYISPLLDKDNMYYEIYEGFTIVTSRCIADISAGKTEWGSWMGHIVNLHRPQDYIDVDIMGYSTRHEVICNINVIRANEILSGKQVIIKTDPDYMEESIRREMQDAIKQFDSYMREAVEILIADSGYPLQLYSPYTFRELSEHYRALEDAGYTRFPVMKKDFKEMNKEEVRNYIQNFLKQYDEELICTSRVLDSLATTVIKMIDSGQIIDAQSNVDKLLVRDSIINFIKRRIPLVDEVSAEVQNSVKAYFEEHLKNFVPIEICRASNHPEDNCLYAVIAKQNNGEYACWTSWHQGRKSINYGHYGLPDRENAFSIIQENFNDISDEIEKYGPEKSKVSVDASEYIENIENKAVVIPFISKSKGR